MEIDIFKINKCRKKLLLVALLNFSDWLCTTTILKYNGFFEVNPLMSRLIDSPVLCFLIKCLVPLALIIYIYKMLPESSDKLVSAVSVLMLFITGFYLAINILHIFNFIILLNMQ